MFLYRPLQNDNIKRAFFLVSMKTGARDVKIGLSCDNSEMKETVRCELIVATAN